MQITRENVQSLITAIEDVSEMLEAIKENAETWNDLQDEDPKTAEIREEIREARENLVVDLESLDVATLCQLVHGKHKR
jgi:hypothetical protein